MALKKSMRVYLTMQYSPRLLRCGAHCGFRKGRSPIIEITRHPHELQLAYYSSYLYYIVGAMVASSVRRIGVLLHTYIHTYNTNTNDDDEPGLFLRTVVVWGSDE